MEPLIKEADVLVWSSSGPASWNGLASGIEALSQASIPKTDLLLDHRLRRRRGPKSAQVAGHDLNYIGDTGLLSLSMGPHEASPVVPPALIADLAGGTYPAVVNILLALLQRHQTGAGLPSRHRHDRQHVHADDLGHRSTGLVTGEWPTSSGRALLTGGTARYHIYPGRRRPFRRRRPDRAEILGTLLRTH